MDTFDSLKEEKRRDVALRVVKGSFRVGRTSNDASKMFFLDATDIKDDFNNVSVSKLPRIVTSNDNKKAEENRLKHASERMTSRKVTL